MLARLPAAATATAVKAASEPSAVESSTMEASTRCGKTGGTAGRIGVGDTSMIESAEGARMDRTQ